MSSPTSSQEHAAQAPDPHPSRVVKGSGLAITALIIAVVSLLLCWIPIVNNLVFFLGLIGLVLGFIAWLSARKGKRSGKGMALSATALSALSLVGVLASQAFYASILDGASRAIDSWATSTETAGSSSASAGDTGAERPDGVYEFGQVVRFEDGSTLKAEAPVRFKPDEFAATDKKAHVKFRVTFVNNSSKVFRPSPHHWRSLLR